MIAAGKSLKLLNNANVGVRVVHSGNSVLNIGSSPAKATVGAYVPSDDSTLNIELGASHVEGHEEFAVAYPGFARQAGAVSMAGLFAVPARPWP